MIYWNGDSIRILAKWFGWTIRVNLGRVGYIYRERGERGERHGVWKLW